MEKNVGYALVVIAVAFLLIGGLVGYNMAPTKVVTETNTEVVYQNVTVEKIVEVAAPNQLELAVAEFMKAVEDEEDESGEFISILEDMNYDFDEVEQSKVYEGYSVDYTNDETTVSFKIRLRFDEEDEQSEKETYDVTVYFEEDEDTEIDFVVFN